MYQFIVENKHSRKLELTNNPNYAITSIEGIANLNAEIFTSNLAFKDGSQFKSSKVTEREISITVVLLGSGLQVEQSRIDLYNFFSPGEKSILYFKNGTRNCYIEAYVETLEIDPFSDGETAQIGLVATNPYWSDVIPSNVDISKQHGHFQFPFSIEQTGKEFSKLDKTRVTAVINTGAKDTGIVITIKCLSESISNPVIYNYKTGEFFKINTTMIEGDVITIDTNNRKVNLERNFKNTNLIGYKTVGSTWLTVDSGINLFTYDADDDLSEHLSVFIEHKPLYYGL